MLNSSQSEIADTIQLYYTNDIGDCGGRRNLQKMAKSIYLYGSEICVKVKDKPHYRFTERTMHNVRRRCNIYIMRRNGYNHRKTNCLKKI